MRGNKFKYLYKSALIRNDSYLGNNHKILDIGMRMLQPHEVYATQGFLSGGYYFSKMKGDNFGCFTIKKYEKRPCCLQQGLS